MKPLPYRLVLAPVRAVFTFAFNVEMQRMFRQFEAMFFCDRMLAAFDFFIEKFFHMAALQAQQVVMMAASVKLIDRLVIVEMMPDQYAGMLKLGQYPINRGQSYIDTVSHQQTIHIVRRQMPLIALLEQGKNFQAWSGDFQAQSLELISTGHGVGWLGVAD